MTPFAVQAQTCANSSQTPLTKSRLKASMRTVLKNLVDGLSEAWVRMGKYWRIPCKSSITEARQRVGAGVMSRLFHLIVKPLATIETPGAFLEGLRVMAVDGTVFDVPDTQSNARVFGYPGTRPGTRAAFPKVRLVLLIANKSADSSRVNAGREMSSYYQIPTLTLR